MAQVLQWLWLSTRKGLTNLQRLRLLEAFGSAEEVYWAEEREYLRQLPLSEAARQSLGDKSLEEAHRLSEQCQQKRIRILTLSDSEYPVRLANIYDAPLLLYVRGQLPMLDEEAAVAVVGTRRASAYGLCCAYNLGKSLAQEGAVVVSGMARGIDAMAMQGALRAGGSVVGVLGCGVDVVYPAENRALYEDVVQMGALLSEYPPQTEPRGAHFPVRNRILSGLSVATLVVEAPERSGALLTAHCALEQGRDVYAVPGAVNAPNSRGCNRLIRDGAGLCIEGWDILQDYAARFPHKLRKPQGAMDWEDVPQTAEKPKETPPAQEPAEEQEELRILNLRDGKQGLTDDQIRLLCELSTSPMAFDDLLERTEVPVRRALSALTMLEIENYVQQHPGKYFSARVRLLK